MFGAYFWLDENEYYVVEYLHWVPILSAMFYILGFSFGFGPVPWLMMGEILPLSIRGFAAGMLSSYNWLCAWFIQMFFLFMLGRWNGRKAGGAHLCAFFIRPAIFSDTLRESGTFWLFAAFCVAGFYAIVLVPETKGKSLEMIEAELMNDTERVGFMDTFNL